MVLAMFWYAVDARRWFRGPRVNVEHLVDGRTGGNGSEAFSGGSEEKR